MRPRADLGAILGLTLRSARAGAAALGLSLALSADSLGPLAALFVVGGLVVIGSLFAARRQSATIVCIVLSACFIALGRQAAGVAGAAIVTALVLLAAWARLRVRDALSGMAVFGALVAVLAGASLGLVLSFWLVGWAAVLISSIPDQTSRLNSGMKWLFGRRGAS